MSKKGESSDSRPLNKDYEMDLFMLEERRNVLFEFVQKVYQNALKAHTNPELKEKFLGSVATIDEVRTEFRHLVDEYNRTLLRKESGAKPNYQPIIAFEEVYCQIKRVLNLCEPPSRAELGQPVKPKLPSLPPVELMSFDGDIRNWPLFYASFKSRVHDNPSLSDDDRLYYLIGKLAPKAQAVFSGITPCADNYRMIINCLIDRYQDTRMLASAYLDQMNNFKMSGPASSSNLQLFMDKFVTAANAVKHLNLIDLADYMLLHTALKKLDDETILAFEMKYRDVKVPTFGNLTAFVKSQYRVYQNTQPSTSAGSSRFSSKTQPSKLKSKIPNVQAYVASVTSTKCLCQEIVHEHFYKCPTFDNLTPIERFKCVKENNACINCLSLKHRTRDCGSNLKCRHCLQKHHSLLHRDKVDNRSAPSSSDAATPRVAQMCMEPTRSLPSSNDTLPSCNTSVAVHVQNEQRTSIQSTTILLSTAQVLVYDNSGNSIVIRCLLDSASQSNFITQDCCIRLGLNYNKKIRMMVRGIGGLEKSVKGTTDFKIFSRLNNSSFDVSGLVVDRITEQLPTAPVDESAFSHIAALPLADDSFASPAPVDVLLGASIFPHLLLPNMVHSTMPGIPPAIQTVLGYIIMGSVPTLEQASYKCTTACCSIVNDSSSLDHLLRKFWELEEVTASPTQSQGDLECEYYFRTTTTRDDSGRYTVALPFCDDAHKLGDSKTTAHRRFLCLERKLEASSTLRAAYDDIIREYVDKGYISEVSTEGNSVGYFIPTLVVIRNDKDTTKVRMVLDSSCKTSTGLSLNDVLHSGPNLQGDLFCILLNFRLFKIALAADCRQMYLQIGVRDSDRRFQRILFRFHPQESMSTYEFNRVCFGMKSSPFHALRVVRQLISDEGYQFPTAASIASNSTYMDDVCFSIMAEDSSSNDVSVAVAASKELISLFKRGQFDLVKWTSNSASVLSEIPATYRASTDLEIDRSAPQKILGLHWDKLEDFFYFKVNQPDSTCTKRNILSAVARLWDVVGLVAPTVLYAKLLIQELWLIKCDWDAIPPQHIVQLWQEFCAELPKLNEIRIPRHLGVVQGCTVTLLGFGDASERAYGGVVYLRVVNGADVTVQLVCSKSKVAPLKTISIARLELCAAVLLSKLVRKVLDNYERRYKINQVYAFTDSKIVLCWINASPHRWQTFVANRVVKIIENVPANCFHHVAGVENPADCLSRGLSPAKLVNHPLWYQGPPWILNDPSEWPIKELDRDSIEDMPVPEQKVLSHAVTTDSVESPIYKLSQRISSWSKLLRITVYIYRFLKFLPRVTITRAHLEFAERKVLISLQVIHFSDDIKKIKNKEQCSPSLQRLHPFLDEEGLIRVGGRLSNATVDYMQKHPYVLPRHDHVVNMIVDYFHKKHLHAGPELLMSLLRSQYWILAARRVIRQRIYNCNKCFRAKPRPTFPLMADLPSCRVNQVEKPFTNTGCDYAGPLQYTPVRGRGVKSRKAWLCIFTCLTTRCIHIEIATELSTANFLSALKRFLSRRGPVKSMFSDRGTNFVGSNSYLRDLYKFLDEYRPHLEHELSENRIDWTFNPPASAHFGGSWESMVKVIKNHLFKVVGQQILTYEELLTVLAQIEALVNSRPLTAMSSDPSEPAALTPAHFLHTVPLHSLPAPYMANVTLQERYSLLDKIVKSFWQRWHVEYLHQLQTRAKWAIPTTPIQIGTVVVIITDNIPPFSWPLGIVEAVHPSKDGTTRVVTVKTSKGTFLRPVVRLCPLPSQ